jgi:uncharacterized membrane protein YvlD (DUF360 family)
MNTLIRIGLTLLGNALGLWLVSLLVDGVALSGSALVLAVLIFSVLVLVIQPIVGRLAEKYADSVRGLSSLVTTFIALVLTSLLSDGFDVDGVGTWIVATLLVWVITLAAGVLLPRFLLDRDTDNS